jgi:glycosyltransferase involved in cell wall biosynthesis
MTGEGRAWSILTPEYPPGAGGVGDYTALLAERLVDAGDEVSVWTPGHAPADGPSRVRVRALPDRFGPSSAIALSNDWKRAPVDTVALVQYVPHGFGWKGMNVPFAAWLGRCPLRLWLMVHEPLYPFATGQPLKHDILAGATWLMLRLAARRAERLFVSTPAWESFLPRSVPAEWLPIPATVTPQNGQPSAMPPATARPSVAHFGTYGEHLTGPLMEIFGSLLAHRPDLELRLIGRGSEAFRSRLLRSHPGAADRVLATGATTPETVAAELAAASVVLFPFVEGATARRTSLMSALGVGAAIVTTEGWCSESVWRESGAVELVPIGQTDPALEAVLGLLANEGRREALRKRASKLYAERFHIDRVVERLRALRA